MTNYEKLFGSPERMAEYIAENCAIDCFACPFASDVPCFRKYSIDRDEYAPILLEWLNKEADA